MSEFKTVTQLADAILKGASKLSDVPEFRRKPVQNLMRIAKPEAIAAMAAKDNNKSASAKVDKNKLPSRFFGTRIREVKSA